MELPTLPDNLARDAIIKIKVIRAPNEEASPFR